MLHALERPDECELGHVFGLPLVLHREYQVDRVAEAADGPVRAEPLGEPPHRPVLELDRLDGTCLGVRLLVVSLAQRLGHRRLEAKARRQHVGKVQLCVPFAGVGDVLVNEGDLVEAGSQIATVGISGKVDVPQLHFEIRKSRQPIDPRVLIT